MVGSQIASDGSAKVSSNYSLRRPDIEEIRLAFGSLTRAVQCCRGDLPTLCFFLANPAKITDFKPQKGIKHRNANLEFSRWLRDAALEEREAARKLARATKSQTATDECKTFVLTWLLKYRSPADPIPVRNVLKAMRDQGRVITRKEFVAAINGSVWVVRS